MQTQDDRLSTIWAPLSTGRSWPNPEVRGRSAIIHTTHSVATARAAGATRRIQLQQR
jgi:hypothetical protein